MASLYKQILSNVLVGVAHEMPLATECLALVEKYKKEKWVGFGRNRAVFRRGSYVVKVPVNDAGVADNQHEAYLFQRYGKTRGYVAYARCRMAGVILVMEYVEHVGWSPQNKPDWTWSVDCGQVGRNAKGELLAYDFGLT